MRTEKSYLVQTFCLLFFSLVFTLAVLSVNSGEKKSPEISRIRQIEFRISANEPTPGLIGSITVCVVERDGKTPLSVPGWTNGCRTASGGRLNETMQVPDAIKSWLTPIITIKINDPIKPVFEFSGADIDFRDTKSALNSSALIVREYNFVNLEITSIEKLPAAGEKPVPSNVEISAKNKNGKIILLGRIQPASFRADATINFRFPVEKNFSDFLPLLEINGRLRKPSTVDLLAKQTLVVRATGGDEKIRIEYGDPVAEIRPVLRRILLDAGIGAAQVERIVSVPVEQIDDPLPSGARWENDPRILLNRAFSFTNPDYTDSLMHEWTHQIFFVLNCQAAVGDSKHDAIRYPASSQQLAWDEGMMHLIGSHLLNRALRQRGVNTTVFSDGKEWLDDEADQNRSLVMNWKGKPNPIPKYTHLRMDSSGNWIEAIPAGAFLEWYGQDFYKRRGIADPETDAIPMLRQIFIDLRGYFAANTDAASWTLEGFFLYLRGVLPPEMQRKVDQHLLWYVAAERPTIERLEKIERLVPAVLTSAMPAAAKPKIGDAVSVKVSARAIRRLIGEYRGYGGSSLKISLFEGSSRIGNEINFGGANPETGYDAAAIFQPVFNTEGAHKLRAEIWGDFIDGTMEKLGETPELAVDIGKGATDLSSEARAKYQWLKDALPYLQELLELDERTFRDLEKAVEKEVRKRMSGASFQPLNEAERKRLSELDAELSHGVSINWKPLKDPLTGQEEYHFIAEGKTSPSEIAKAKEWGELKARGDSEFGFTYYTNKCIYGETEKHLQRQRELKKKISLLEDSTVYKNFQEYANLGDFENYLKAVETLNKQLNLPAPIPRPAVLMWTYAAPCASVSATVSNAPSVRLKANPNPVKPNAVANVTADVAGGKAPYKFVWSGDVKPQGGAATFSNQKAGEYPISVIVTDASGNTASADLKIRVSAMLVKLEMTPPALKIAFGTSRSLKAALTSDGQEITGNFVYRWENNQDIKFSEDETRVNTTNASFLKPGRQTLWVSVLTAANGVLSTVAESEPVEVEVAAPPFSINFNPPAPFIGQETKATLAVPGNLPKDAIDFRWLLPDNAKILGESADSREIAFVPLSDLPVNFTVTAREPVVGTEFGKATATLKASTFNVTAIVVGINGALSPEIALVNKPGAFAVNQEIKLRAAISPTPKTPVKFVWSVAPNGANQIVGLNVGAEIAAARNQIGICEIAVEAFDANNVRLGKAATSFNVTISAAEIEAAKKTKLSKEKLAEAKLIIRKGKLAEAVKLLEEAIALDAKNAEAAALLEKTKNEIATIHAQLEKYRAFAQESRFTEAQRELIVAQNINSYYQPVAGAMVEYRDLYFKYDAAVKEKLGAMQIANDNRQFHKTLEIARQTRGELKLHEYNLENFNRFETWAKTHEAEKERQRAVLKRGEEKYRNYDFAGAYDDLNVMFAKGDFYEYWNSNYDAEPPYYQKLKDDAFLKNKRINELLPNIRSVADDLRLAAPIVEKAITDCDEILKIQPPNAEAKQLRAALSERLRKTNAAAKIATLAKQAEQLVNQGNYNEAVNIYTRAIALDSANSEFYQKRASARRHLKDFTNALADYDKAVELNPQNHLALTGRGMTKVNLGDSDGALADFDRSISVHPNYPLAYNERGLIKFKGGDPRGALADFSKAVQLDLASAVYVNNQGAAKEELDDLKGALADYEKSLVINPNYELAKNNLARVKAKMAETAIETPSEKQGETGYVDISGVAWNWYDPNADASYNVSGDTIVMRAPKGNDLWTTTNFDAPRLTKKVTGDFILQTRLQANWRQDYNGSGLTVYAGQTSVIRFERGINGFGISGHHVALVGFAAGRETGRGHILFPNTDLYLRLIRKGNEFTGFAGTDGVNWQKVAAVTAQFPQTVDAGLVLVNEYNSNIFQTTFSEFKLIQATDAAPQPNVQTEALNVGNIYGVGNAPTAPTQFTVLNSYTVTFVQTYHWNNGRGAQPGTIALKKDDGQVFGSWEAVGKPGQGGVPNAYWEVSPKAVIPAGTYTIVDSDPASWAQNAQSGGRGFAIVIGFPLAEQTPPNAPPKQTTGVFVTAIFENRSGETVHIFTEGENFSPQNRLAPGEKREVKVRMTVDGRIKFVAGRNGQILTAKIWMGDADDTNRFPRVIFDGTQLIVTTGLR